MRRLGDRVGLGLGPTMPKLSVCICLQHGKKW